MLVMDQIDELFKKSMSEKDEVSLSVARLLKSAIKNAEIEKKSELSDDEVMVVLTKQAKQRRDSIDQYEKGERPELAEQEKKELAIIEKFLPEKMGEGKIREIVKKKVAEHEGDSSTSSTSSPQAGSGQVDFGRVMGAVMGELKGKADGGTVQKIVKEELGE